MRRGRIAVGLIGWTITGLALGCSAPNVNFADIKPPPRPAELDAYEVFVGTWNWEAEMLNAEGPDRNWTGTAEWKWTLDKRSLNGNFVSQNQNTKFEAEGKWSWHPREKKYIWGMFNNWGYPQRGTASYDADDRRWTMEYVSVGLDGTPSRGRYTIRVVDGNTLHWSMTEWRFPFHIGKKVEMTGKYTRKK